MKNILIAILISGLYFLSTYAQQQTNERYEPVSISKFKIVLELSGPVRWDENNKAQGGPIESLSFFGQKLELTNNMIRNGFIHTKDYGNIKVVPNPNFSFHIELTPSQQKKTLKLKK